MNNYKELFNNVVLNNKSTEQINIENELALIVDNVNNFQVELNNANDDLNNAFASEKTTKKELATLFENVKIITAKLETAKAEKSEKQKELDNYKKANPVKVATCAEYCLYAMLNSENEITSAKALASKAIALMPEHEQPATTNGTEMTARGILAVFQYLKK